MCVCMCVSVCVYFQGALLLLYLVLIKLPWSVETVLLGVEATEVQRAENTQGHRAKS